MQATELLYMGDAYLWETEASLLAQETREDGRVDLILDRTIFYPQGGGQPFDQGWIHTDSCDFRIEETRFTPDGIVHHIGFLKEGSSPEILSKVKLKIDQPRRLANNKLHTAGHLIDAAMYTTGFRFEPAKGYHFPDSPYVEYVGVIPAEEREQAILKLNTEMARMIAEDQPVEQRIVQTKEELKTDCLYIPDYLLEGKPIRVVTVAGFGCPCGGTHVKSNGELGSVEVRKIKSKKGLTRVSYAVN